MISMASRLLLQCAFTLFLSHLAEVGCLQDLFLDWTEANNFLRRSRRSNEFFEEFRSGNLERECIEETCTREEAREISDDDIEGANIWEKYLRCTRAPTFKTGREMIIRVRNARSVRRSEREKLRLKHCVLDKDQCKPFPCVRSNTASCRDVIESYECVCKPGFAGRNCQSPINECLSDPCYGSARCEDEIGGFRCLCDAVHEGILCENEIRDCRNVPSKLCGRRGKCLQTEDDAPFKCVCDPGYTGDTCSQDIDECASSPCQHNCTNTDGGFECSCLNGFLLDLKSKTSCVDVDECAMPTSNNCQHTCHNTRGGYYCACSSGYILDDVFSRYCEDIDECAINNGGCPVIEGGCGSSQDQCKTCHNVPGGHTCYCPPGFRPYVKGRNCEDIDECETDDHGCQQGCENLPGGFRCLCQDGFKLSYNKKSCIDVNECLLDHGCQYRCTNNPGSYQCSCARGFKLAEDERSCLDVDECSIGDTRCTQICVNSVGSYACDCKAGYRLSGKYRCYDINDCASSPCGRYGRCHDGENSYSCECRHGFGGKHCEIDENPCLKNPCLNGGTCLRKDPGYYCSCQSGFRGNTCEEKDVICEEGYALLGDECIDVDECLEEGACDHNCENTEGSFTCTCNTGYSVAGNRCEDVDECSTNNQCDQNCENTPGSFLCSCDEGYVLRSDALGCEKIYSCFSTTPVRILSEPHLLLGTRKNDYVANEIRSLNSTFSLTFEYRTLDPDALLLAMSDRSSQRYIYVVLQEGRLEISANLDDLHKETKEEPVGEEVLDAKWHTVSIKKRKNRIRISKDGNKLRDLRFSNDDFGSVNMLYYGGLPPDFLPRGGIEEYANKRLQGCLRRMLHSGLHTAANSAPSPIHTGCFESIRSGIYFSGTGYISTDISGGSNLRMRFSFKSRNPRGTIAVINGSGGDEFTLKIEGNQLEAEVLTSIGQRFSSRYTAENVGSLCNGEWHVCDVTVSGDRIRLHVDGLHAQVQDFDGMRNVELTIGETILYLGGRPGGERFFAGSLRDFKLNNELLDLSNPMEVDGVYAYSIPRL